MPTHPAGRTAGVPTVSAARRDTARTVPRTRELARLWSDCAVAGRRYRRAPIGTRWLTPAQDLASELVAHTPDRRPGDTVVLSEKVAVLLLGHALPVDSLDPGPLARILGRLLRRRPGALEHARRTCGRRRVVLAALAAGATRLLGIRGVFDALTASGARDLGGARPPYDRVLLPPLAPRDAEWLCRGLERALGTGVAIAAHGRSVRATSPLSLAAPGLAQVLADRPLGSGLDSTPFVLVRPAMERRLSR